MQRRKRPPLSGLLNSKPWQKRIQGVLTYKEIQDRMQNTDSISVDEMDEIYSKLAEKNIEVVDDMPKRKNRKTWTMRN